MAHFSRTRPVCLAAAALGLAALPLTAADGPRNYDRRTTLAAPDAPALGPRQAQAVDVWRAAVPELRVSLDRTTGATRTLSNAVGFLTGPRQGGDIESIAVAFALEQLDLLGLVAADLDGYEVTDSVTSKATGVTHLYLRQRYAGIPVYNGQLHFNVAADGRILSVNNGFVPRLAQARNTDHAELDAAAAVAAALSHAGDAARPAGPFSPRLMYLPTRPGEARLVWNLQVETTDGEHWYDVTVDATDGRIWTRFDWVADAEYKVYPVPVEAPTFTAPAPPADGRVTVVDPQNATASPFGWHDTDGVPGADTTLTSGNNVNACIDRSPANNVCDPGSQPDGGAGLVFTPPIDLTQHPTTYQPAAVVNLYYWNNVIHDVAYLYGFDEVAGNFQENNYGNGGLGSDSVHGDAQDGAGNNNANFATPPDGTNPRMQMFLWTIGTPNRDGDLDDGIIAHEYGHGISNRLVGGPGSVGCLGNAEQPGEGLSDWWSLFYTFEAANNPVRGIGTYALFEPTTGDGIRNERYDKTVEPNSNTWTYASVQGSVIPHGVGEKWAQAYWYVQGRLEDQYGFDADIYNYTGTGADAGNVRAMFYIIEGLKNAVCSPGFVDTRDGILAAAASSYGGADVCLLWQAFADYGLGANADQGSSGSINDQIPAFDVPQSCQAVNAGADVAICAGQNVERAIDLGGAFTPPVTMSASGNPAPSTAAFSPNPVLGVPSTTTLTIANTAGVPAGTYPITVSGDDGGGPQDDIFDLQVVTALPPTTTLVAPADGATGVPVAAPLSWTMVLGATSYDVEVDDNPDFSSPEFSAAEPGLSTVAAGLSAGTKYYWRARANTVCPGSFTAARRFVTAVEYCRAPAVAIPDADPTGVTDVLDVALADMTIVDLDLSIQATHTRVGDLSFTLRHGGATPTTGFDRPGVPGSQFGCEGDDVDVLLDDAAATPVETTCGGAPPAIAGTLTPNVALAAYAGHPISGSWTLQALDAAAGDTGTLVQWCLKVAVEPVDTMPFQDGFESGDLSAWSAKVP